MISEPVRAGDARYLVLIGRDLLRETGRFIRDRLPCTSCVVIADENVAPLLSEKLLDSLRAAGFKPFVITVPPGEQSKSFQQAQDVVEQMVAAGLDRTSFVVALGGGVIGDLAGFVAATFHRGIPYVQVPTTLLAQVDSSIGGKTAVNIPSGKNLVGAVYQPVLVIADIDTLSTLPPRELRQGFAEIVKHGIIADGALFNALPELSRDNLAELVRRNVAIKAAIVARDEHDTTGERAILNFGHTVGHAIEAAGGYRDFLHGEAVSLGMVAACGVSVRKAGFPEAQRDRVIAALQSFDLPTHLPASVSRDKIMSAIPRDKKFEDGQVRFVVTPALGCARVATDVTLDDIEAAVATL